MTKYCTRYKAADEVPDPYYGGPAGFEKVLDLLEDASEGLLSHIQQEQKHATGS
jgi:protein-tyrosine phosphatase